MTSQSKPAARPRGAQARTPLIATSSPRAASSLALRARTPIGPLSLPRGRAAQPPRRPRDGTSTASAAASHGDVIDFVMRRESVGLRRGLPASGRVLQPELDEPPCPAATARSGSGAGTGSPWRSRW